MSKLRWAWALVWGLGLVGAARAAEKSPRAYVFFGMDRERISEKSFLENRGIEGAQLKYSWRQLERGEGEYEFEDLRKELEFLTTHGKRLWVQVQDASFDEAVKPFPKYLLNDPKYHGGADRQYVIVNDDEGAAKPGGWVARRWDPAVRERWHRLLAAMGKEFDGRIEGINLAETAVDFGETGKLFPPGFTREGYREAVVENMRALKNAFPKSVAMQYANFMPEEVGAEEPRNLKAVFEAAMGMGVALGGPDLLPYKRWQMRNSYPLIKEVAGRVRTGIAVQDGNFEHVDPRSGKRVKIGELVSFAREYLGVDYVFWGTEEPYYSRDVLPYFGSKGNK